MKKLIGYISPQIPKVEFPPYEGERYEALVPDTLDMAERADIAIHGITSIADPEADYEIWWWAVLNRKPPVLVHDFHDWNIQGKFLEALPQLRTITGSDLNLHVDTAWAEDLLHMQGEDGLLYFPIAGRPWARYHSDWLGGKGDDGVSDQLASFNANGNFLGDMALYYLLSKDEVWKRAIQRLVDRLEQFVVYKDDYCHFPLPAANPGAKISQDMKILDPGCTGEVGSILAGWVIQSLCQAYVSIGYEPALTLAGKLSVGLKEHSGCYDKDGRFTGCAHTHLHTRPISGLLEYALIANDQEMLEFCRKSYEYAKSCGSPTVGFFPSIPGPDTPYNYTTIQRFFRGGVEGCTVADMVALAIKLSQGGVADYWDDVDRYVRNQFVEIQILKTDWINRMIAPLPTTSADETKHENADRALERNIGNCWPVTSPSEFLDFAGWSLMHCCTGNYARAIPYIWDNILSFEDGTLRVNLLLNRTSPWADLESYIPYEGRVDIKVRKPCKLSVRIPEWVKPEETACKVNDQVREPGWKGRYAQVGEVKSGDVVALTLPISERTVRETINGVDYNLIIKGSTVVSIDPPGKHNPFYQRAHYRENKVRLVKQSRFISSKPSLHWHY